MSTRALMSLYSYGVPGSGGGATKRFQLSGDNTGAPSTVIDGVGVISWTLTGAAATQQTGTKKFGTGAFFWDSETNTNLESLESSAFSWSGSWTLSLWAKGVASVSGQYWVFTFGERDVAGSFTLIISPGSFATLVCWTGGGSGTDCGFTSTSSDFSQFTAAGGARIIVQYDGTSLTWGIENGSGSVVNTGSPLTLAHTVVTSKTLMLGRAAVDSGHTSFTGGWEGYVDSLYGQTGGALYGSWPITAPTSEYTP